MYVSVDGIKYSSYAEYCNSDDLDEYLVMHFLEHGKRTPQNDNEKELLEEIRDIKRKGGVIDYSNF